MKTDTPKYTPPRTGTQKKRIWLWVLGWLFLFPVPLTVLMMRNRKLNFWAKIGIVAAGWIAFLILGLSGGKNPHTAADSPAGHPEAEPPAAVLPEEKAPADPLPEAESQTAAKFTVTKLYFESTQDLLLMEGGSPAAVRLCAAAGGNGTLSPEDIKIAAENPLIAEVKFLPEPDGLSFSCSVFGLSPGETLVLARTADGSVVSAPVRVTVSAPPEAESIALSGKEGELHPDETLQLEAVISPDGAKQELVWSSDNESIAAVDENGCVTAVSRGNAVITAAAPNGVSAQYPLTVGKAQRSMKLNTSAVRQDDVNIGSEWYYDFLLNGEAAPAEITLAEGDTVTCSAVFTEDDTRPDTGEALASYRVKPEDLQNGFSVSMNLYVTENGGRNRGKTAVFAVTYTFSPKAQ